MKKILFAIVMIVIVKRLSPKLFKIITEFRNGYVGTAWYER